MTQLRRITGIFFALLLALTVIPAAAQDEETTDPLEDLSQFEGIENAVSRTWSIDFAAMMEITPEDEGADPFADLTGVLFLYAVVAEFEDDGNAEEMYDYFANIEDEELLADLDDAEAEITREELDDIGDQAQAFSIASTSAESEGYYRYSFARSGEYFFISVSIASDEESAAMADDLLAAMADEDGHSGAGEFNADGTSSGGIWEFFPEDDDELFEGLIPGGDEVLYPVPEDEEDAG